MSNPQTITSIVVLAYNGLEEVTRPCIESILKNTPVGSYELVLVDNASSDDTAAYFEGLAAQHDHVTLCLNQQNKGYAGGNNDGMRLAKGDYIVLLNNDTLVPPGWLDRLLGLLKSNENVGLAGPVTNSAGNEQRIEIPGLNESNFEAVAAPYLERQQGQWFATERLGFYCVAMKRAVMEQVGFLDERFGLGMFEDDDYCIRVRKAGFALAVIEDCFVYHKGSVSFGKLAVTTYRDLFEKNRALFTKLHGMQWSFSDIALGYWEKFNKDLSAYRHSVSESELDPAIERVLVRWENFHHLLVQVHRAELAGAPSGSSKESLTVKRANWKIRRYVFQQKMVHGSWRERWEYLGLLVSWVLQRLKPITTPNGQYPEAQALVDAIPALSADLTVVIFPATVDYSYIAQRPQQLANAFAELGYFVIYGTLNCQSDKVEVAQQISSNLFLLNERYFPHLVHLVHPDKTIYYCMWPNNVKHLEYLPYSRLLYDYMDELSLLDLPTEDLERDHKIMLDKADLVTVSSGRLMDKLPQHVLPKTLLINNAVSEKFIRAVDDYQGTPDELKSVGDCPVLGYYGAIAEWLDFDLIERLAVELPNAKIVLVGPVSHSVSTRIAGITKQHENVLLLSPRKQLDLVPLLKRFDICMIPFVKNDVTDAVSPVKLFEYFSAGKPVVTTDIIECAKYSSVKIGKSRNEFITIVHQLLADYPVHMSKDVRVYALNNTWRHRADQIISRLYLGGALPANSLLEAVQSEISVGLSSERPNLHIFYKDQYAVQERHYWAPVTEWIDQISINYEIHTLVDIGPAYGTLMLYTINKCRPKSRLALDKIRFMPAAVVEKYGIEYQSVDIERDQTSTIKNVDLIIFTEIIEHLNFHPLATLHKLRCMLSPNGILILTTPDAAEWGSVTTYYKNLSDIPPYTVDKNEWIDGHVWQYEKQELDNLLCEAGFLIRAFEYAPGVNGRHLCYELGNMPLGRQKQMEVC